MSDFYVGLICQADASTNPLIDAIGWVDCEIIRLRSPGLWDINVPGYPSLSTVPMLSSKGVWYIKEKHLRKFPDKDQQIDMSDLSDIWTPQELVELEVIDEPIS